MSKLRRAALFLLVFLWLAATAWAALRFYRQRIAPPPGPLTRFALYLNERRPLAFCDERNAARRLRLARVIDRFRPELQALWAKRQASREAPRFALVSVGRIHLRVSPRLEAKAGYESSAFGWEEAEGSLVRTQVSPPPSDHDQRWRDLDSVTQFLLEKDLRRVVQGRQYLEPGRTRHRFAPNGSVQRTGPREFQVSLHAGDFLGHERELARVFEEEWRGEGFRVRVRWVPAGEGVYAMRALLDSNRSFVNHQRRAMLIANLAWTKTVAHELGHILGFDDHYYTVWHDQHCYYSQESRYEDLMSNSERGRVTKRHWQLLDEAYPWKKDGKKEPFEYVYGN